MLVIYIYNIYLNNIQGALETCNSNSRIVPNFGYFWRGAGRDTAHLAGPGIMKWSHDPMILR